MLRCSAKSVGGECPTDSACRLDGGALPPRTAAQLSDWREKGRVWRCGFIRERPCLFMLFVGIQYFETFAGGLTGAERGNSGNQGHFEEQQKSSSFCGFALVLDCFRKNGLVSVSVGLVLV